MNRLQSLSPARPVHVGGISREQDAAITVPLDEAAAVRGPEEPHRNPASNFPGSSPPIIGRIGDVKLSAGALERLKQSVPELGGRDFGFARTGTGNFAIVPLGSGLYRVAAIERDRPPIDHDAPMTLDELRAAVRRVINLDLAMQDQWKRSPTSTTSIFTLTPTRGHCSIKYVLPYMIYPRSSY